MRNDYDDDYEDDEDDEKEDAHLNIVALALREARENERRQKRGAASDGWVNRKVMVHGVECFASFGVGVDRNVSGFVRVEIAYQGVSGVSYYCSFKGWPMECECWRLWDMTVYKLLQQSEAFRRDCNLVPARPVPVSHE
jgi:hypothetical protein